MQREFLDLGCVDPYSYLLNYKFSSYVPPGLGCTTHSKLAGLDR